MGPAKDCDRVVETEMPLLDSRLRMKRKLNTDLIGSVDRALKSSAYIHNAT